MNIGASEEEARTMKAKRDVNTSRRRFLSKAGKLAAVTPPALTLLLAAEGRDYAYAGSGNPGNYKNVGRAGESPNGRNFGTGARGRSR